jgi:antitoxin component of RelBE/YafQ-DinJ toxin-antitoxin module
MDAKITLSFDARVIEIAKNYAKKQGMSLSRLTEYLLRMVTENHYRPLEELPVSQWVSMVAEGSAQYGAKKRGRKSLKDEYYKSRK